MQFVAPLLALIHMAFILLLVPCLCRACSFYNEVRGAKPLNAQAQNWHLLCLPHYMPKETHIGKPKVKGRENILHSFSGKNCKDTFGKVCVDIGRDPKIGAKNATYHILFVLLFICLFVYLFIQAQGMCLAFCNILNIQRWMMQFL